MSLMERLKRSVLEEKLRTKNRTREHAHHGWKEIQRFDETVVLMDCPCGWVGWIPAT